MLSGRNAIWNLEWYWHFKTWHRNQRIPRKRSTWMKWVLIEFFWPHPFLCIFKDASSYWSLCSPSPIPCNLDTVLSYCVNGRMGQPTTSTSVNVIYRLEPMQCDTVSSDLLLNCPACTYIQCRVMKNSERTVAGLHDVFDNSTNTNTNYNYWDGSAV